MVLPDAIVVSETADQDFYGERQRDDSTQLNLRAPKVLSLTDPVPSEPGAAAGAGPDEALVARPAPGAQHGLPQRVRPDSQPADDDAVNPEGIPRHAPVEAPSPDDARSLAASLQSSWHRSRGAQSPPLTARVRRPDDGYRDDADTEEA